jgi:hypothetical protein
MEQDFLISFGIVTQLAQLPGTCNSDIHQKSLLKKEGRRVIGKQSQGHTSIATK